MSAFDTPYQGMIGTEIFDPYSIHDGTTVDLKNVTRPMDWNSQIAYLYPNGTAKLFAILSRMGSQTAMDPHFHWFSKRFPISAGPIAGIFSDAAMTTPYVGGSGVAGTPLYVMVTQDVADHFVQNQLVQLRVSTDIYATVNAQVLSVIPNGAASSIGVRLQEADDNSFQGNFLDVADVIGQFGSAHPEGSPSPTARAYAPQYMQNFTQIIMTSLELTGTQEHTTYRTGNFYEERRREALELHTKDREGIAWNGIKTITVGANNQPQRTTMGIIPWIREYAPNRCYDFRYDAIPEVFPGVGPYEWLDKGGEWLTYILTECFRYGNQERFFFCGDMAVHAINAYIQNHPTSFIQLSPETTTYGLKVMRWVLPMGTLNFVIHPLFSTEQYGLSNSGVIIDVNNIKRRPLEGRDTEYYRDGKMANTGHAWVDGRKELFLTEEGYQLTFPETFAVLTGLGEQHP